MNGMRTKEEIIEELLNLVKTKGYIYALCMILIEDFSFNAEEIQKANVDARLSLNEAAYLVRLLIQDEINFSAPDKLQDLMGLKQKTYELLEELHGSFVDFEKLFKSMANNLNEEGMTQFFSDPEVIAEAIFYSGTGAYDIQHLGLLEEKYKYDKKWLIEKRNFDARASKNTALIIKQILESKRTQNVIPLGLKEKIPEMIEKIKKKHPDDWEEHVEKLSKTIPAMELCQYRILLEKARFEVHERIIGIQRVTFNSVISMVEISLKQYAVENPSQIGDTAERVEKGKNVYLSVMLEECKNEGILSKQELDDWKLLINIRNVLVHGGGASGKRIPDKEYHFNDEKLKIEQGEMARGTPAVITGMIDELLDKLRKLISKLQQKRLRELVAESKKKQKN